MQFAIVYVACAISDGEGLAASFVETTTRDVADPLDDVMVAVIELVLEHFEVTNFEARTRKWNLRRKNQCYFDVVFTQNRTSKLATSRSEKPHARFVPNPCGIAVTMLLTNCLTL